MGLDRSGVEELKSKLEWMEEDMKEGLYLSEDDLDYMETLRKEIDEFRKSICS